ncbi:MAG TPA: hypothetical protein VF141_18705 [Chryseolinea sp.]
MIYFAWLSLRARSLFFFSASNPGIPMGGMFGESKYDILKKLPSQYVPNCALIRFPTTREEILIAIKKNDLRFPLIFKPDLGERGFLVERIDSENDIDNYLLKMKFDFIIQELVDLPLEYGIFYTRFPRHEKGVVTSIVMKEMLSVVGDGKSTLRDLILKKDRAKLQWQKLRQTHRHRLNEVLKEGESVELVSIGNHCLGTKFLDGSYLINERLSETFDNISKQVEGFYFGRFDLRCARVEDLYSGNVKIMELNGCGAEPAHIYQPGYPITRALVVLLVHWKNIFIISRENASRGIPYMSFREALGYYRRFKAATQ